MGGWRRVEDQQAGDDAVGILVPPAPRTFTILRPRSLPWDLLVVRGRGEPAFRDMDRPEAHLVAQQLYRALEAWAAGGDGAVVPFALPGEGLFGVEVVLGVHVLAACAREPGKPYRPAEFAEGAARAAAADLLALLRLSPGQGREVYFNTCHFQ